MTTEPEDMIEGESIINKQKKWHGSWPAKCDLCKEPLTSYKWFIDGRIVNQSYWALICPPCSYSNSAGTGLGIGQKYDSKTLVKLEG
jgi:hypothetical protein